MKVNVFDICYMHGGVRIEEREFEWKGAIIEILSIWTCLDYCYLINIDNKNNDYIIS